MSVVNSTKEIKCYFFLLLLFVVNIIKIYLLCGFGCGYGMVSYIVGLRCSPYLIYIYVPLTINSPGILQPLRGAHQHPHHCHHHHLHHYLHLHHRLHPKPGQTLDPKPSNRFSASFSVPSTGDSSLLPLAFIFSLPVLFCLYSTVV